MSDYRSVFERVQVKNRGKGISMTEMLIKAATDKGLLIVPMSAEDHEVSQAWVARALLLWGGENAMGDVELIVVPDWFEDDDRYAKWFTHGTWKGVAS